MRQICFGLMLLGAGLGPLAPTTQSTHILRLIINMFFVLGGMLWLISMAVEGRARFRRTGVGTWLLLFFGAIVASVVNAAYKYPAALTAFGWVAGIIGFAYVVNEARTRRARLLLIGVIGASALAVSLHGVHQRLVEMPRGLERLRQDRAETLRQAGLSEEWLYDLEGRLGSNRVFSTFISPNSLAGFLVLVVPACVGLLMDWGRRRRQAGVSTALLAGVVLLLPMLLALYLTKSKGGWIGFLAAGGAFVVWGFWEVLWRRRMQILCAVLGLLIVGLVAQGAGLLPPVRDYFGSFKVRYGYWRGGMAILERRWHIGVGLGNFADFYAQYKRAEDQEARHAHNDYVEMAAEMGLLGLVLYGALWVQFWRRVRKREGEPMFPPEEKAGTDSAGLTLLVLLSGVIFALEHACGGTFLTSEGVFGRTWPIALWMGWLVYMLLYVDVSDDPGPVRGSYATAGMGCGLIGFLVHSLADFNHFVGGTYQTAWLMMGLLLASRLSEEREVRPLTWRMGAMARLGTTVVASGLSLALLYGAVLPAAEAHNLKARALDATTRRGEAERRLDLEAAIERNPWDAHNYALLSDALAYGWWAGRQRNEEGGSTLSEAILLVKEAIKRNPVRSEYYTRLGRLYELRWRLLHWPSDYHGGLSAYLRAEVLFPSNPDTALNVGRMYDRRGRHEPALGKYFRARIESEEQYYQRTRGFKPAEMRELNERINALKVSVTAGTAPPPLRFTEPRLLGWPGRFFPKQRPEGREADHGQGEKPVLVSGD